jgi:hypothetical protein
MRATAPLQDQHARPARAEEPRPTPAVRTDGVEDAVEAHQRPKLEMYDDVVFLGVKPAATSSTSTSWM